MKIQSFKDLLVWQKGMELSETIYRLTQKFPPEELYGLTSQIRRATVSIPANIAEGWGRQSTGDYIRFLKIAQGSVAELETELILAQRLGLICTDHFQGVQSVILDVQKMLRSLILSLQSKRAVKGMGLVLLGAMLLLA